MDTTKKIELHKFREACGNPAFVGANRLIVQGEGANAIIVAADVGDNIENSKILNHLRTALQAEHTKVQSNTLFEKTKITSYISTSEPLSTIRLQQILAAADCERNRRVAAGELLKEPETVFKQLKKIGTTVMNKKKTARETNRDFFKEILQQGLNFFMKNDKLAAQAANRIIPKRFEDLLCQAKEEQEKREVVESLVHTMIHQSRTLHSFNAHYKIAKDCWIEADEARNQRPFTRWDTETKKEFHDKAVELLEELKSKLENKDIDNTPLGKAAWFLGILGRPITWINLGIDGKALHKDLVSVLEFANTTIEKYPTASASFAVRAAMKDYEAAAERARHIEETAPALFAKAQKTEEAAMDDDCTLTMALAKCARPPLDTSEELWKKWATDFIESSRIVEQEKDEVKELFIVALSSQGRALHSIITNAWRQRKDDSAQYAEKLTQPDSLEAEAFRDLNKKYQAAHHEAMLLRTALDNQNDAEARLHQAKGDLTDLENQEKLVPPTTSAADNLEARRRLKIKATAKLEEVFQLELVVQVLKAKADSQKLTIENAEAKISETLNSRFDQEENFKRNIARAKVRAEADQEAWKATWPEIYFKELADEVWKEAEKASEIGEAASSTAHACCAEAGTNWIERASEVGASYVYGAKCARNAEAKWRHAAEIKSIVLNITPELSQNLQTALAASINEAEAKRYRWTKRAIQAEKNALDSGDPRTSVIKERIRIAKVAWLEEFSNRVDDFDRNPDHSTLASVAVAARAVSDATSWATLDDADDLACWIRAAYVAIRKASSYAQKVIGFKENDPGMIVWYHNWADAIAWRRTAMNIPVTDAFLNLNWAERIAINAADTVWKEETIFAVKVINMAAKFTRTCSEWQQAETGNYPHWWPGIFRK